MRLISLTANKESFHPVYFNETGLTLITGRQSRSDEPDDKKTYNGVGKSLIVALVHFCLGSSGNKGFAASLPDWEFTLEFRIGDDVFTATRSADTQNRILLNGEEFTKDRFNSELESQVFNLKAKVPGVTFKSLLNRFIRPGKSSYVAFDKVQEKETDYYKLLCLTFLLGIDIDFVLKKRDYKVELDAVKEFRGNLNKDAVFREFFTEGKDIEIERRDLADRIESLEGRLGKFQVAENYDDIKRAAAETKREILDQQNYRVVLLNAIENIDASLEVRGDIPAERVIKIFDETRAKFPEALVKEIQEIQAFHKGILQNRLARLTGEKERLLKQLEFVGENLKKLNRKRDSELRFLGAHGALDDMVSVTNQLTDLKVKAQKITDYTELLQRYSDQTEELKIKLSNETRRTNAYLRATRELTDSNLDRFRSFSRQFYADKPGGLTVINNEGENQLRFDINAHIQDDASDGINEVKMFCFDMTLLSGRHNHRVNFLFHDSRLFSNMDPRQRATSFRIAHEHTMATGSQYIATLNEDQITSMQESLGNDLNRIITDNVVVELTDESPETKLLGIEIDMQYE